MRYLIVTIIAVVVGFIAGRQAYFQPMTPSSSSDNYKQKYEELQAKFEKLSEIDIAEYLLLKEQKEKYEKADEVLGKIVAIFLLDLGIRSSRHHLSVLQSRAGNSDQVPTQAQPIVPTRPTAAIESGAPVSKRDWIKESVKTPEVMGEADLKDFLSKVEIKDMFGELKSAGHLSESQLRIINGSYFGEVVFDDKNREPWQVELHLEGFLKNGKLEGKEHIVLSKGGKVFSRSRGGPKDFMSFADDSTALLINSYGDDGYMQLYHFPQLGLLSGLIYMQKSVGVFTKAGTVSLKRGR